MNKESIKDFLTTFTRSIDEEHLKLYEEMISNIKIEDMETPEYFYMGLLYPWGNFVEALLKTHVSNNRDVVFIYKNYRYIDSHLSNLFGDVEGSACSCDKSRTIINSLVKFFIDGKEIKFNYEQEYTYQLPKKILKTHEQIISYYEGLKSFHYGRPENYLKALTEIQIEKLQKTND